MIKKIKSLSQSNFVKDTAILQVGTIFSTGLSFLASVIFARVLGPEKYGQYALIFSLTGLFGIFMNWGADYATITLLAEAWAKRDKEEIKNIIIFFIKFSLIATLTVGLLALIFSPLLAQHLYHNEQIGHWARVVILTICFQFIFSLLTIILQAARKIKHLTILENINKTAGIVIPTIFVLIGLGLYGIVWGNLLAVLFFVFLSFYIYHVLLKRTELLPSFKIILYGLKNISTKKYIKFGLTIAFDKNLANLSAALPMIFLGMTVSPTQISYFKIAFAYIGLSLILLKPISRLLMVQLPKSKVMGYSILKEHFFKTTIYSFLIVLIIIIPMLILAKFLVLLVYGANYLPCVKLIYWLWPYALISSLTVGIGTFYRTINKVKMAVVVNFLNLIIGTPIFYWLIKNYGLTGMIISVTLCLGIPVLIILCYISYQLKKINIPIN